MPKVTAEQIEAVKAEFKEFDKNNDGKLTKKEYYIMLRSDGKDLNEKHMKVFFFAMQPDANGAIKFDDMVSLMNDAKNGNTDKLKAELSKNLFKHYDKNHDNSIGLKEFKRIARDFDLDDEVKAKELFDKVDTNDNNKVSAEELLQSISSLFGF